MIGELPTILSPGNPAVSDAFEAWRDAIYQANKLKGAGLVRDQQYPDRQVLSLQQEYRPWVQLVGSTNPYDAYPVYPVPSAGVGSGVGWEGGSLGLIPYHNVYEDEGVNGLDTQVVRIRPGSPGEWRFRFVRYGTGPAIPGCHCVPPTTLTMTSSKPSSNNHMFQNATLVYGPTPTALLPLNLGANCFLSTAQFQDYSTNDMFWYYLGCYQGFFTLTRVYAVSHYASPYRDQIRYRWLTGVYGNTCSPFSMAHGAMYAGGDSTCIVSITG